MHQLNVCLTITVCGDVQGVGFRPRVKRLADQLGVTGWVRNERDRVRLHVQADASAIKALLTAIRNLVPGLQILQEFASRGEFFDFSIVDSVDLGAEGLLQFPADNGICADCVREFHDPASRRFRYPLISCHDCGPRFSILRGMPFAREQTAFDRWQPCERCRAECSDPADRRYHSELISCPDCGPQLQWIGPGISHSDSVSSILQQAIVCLRDGGILALKSQTGMQLLCRADAADVVARLRQIKQRPRKPLALLLESIAQAQQLAQITDAECNLLDSPARPIVLLPKRMDSAIVIADNVAEGVPDWGILLPVSGLHIALLQGVGLPLVCTSANVSGEAVLFENAEIVSRVGVMCDGALVHDIDIHIPQDDSVFMQTAGRNMVLRRARGLAHHRFSLPLNMSQLALGGDLKHAFALACHGTQILGPYVGDCDTFSIQQRQQLLYSRLSAMHGFSPQQVVADKHPGYVTHRQATAMAGVRAVGVQHHLAHVLTQHGLCECSDRYLALAWDGNGWGDDATGWGSEVYLVEQGVPRRVAALAPFSLPGGVQAARQPWRMALALGFHAGMTLSEAQTLALAKGVDVHGTKTVWKMLERNLNNPAARGMGRLFDGISHVLTACSVQAYEGEAAILLQAQGQGGKMQSHRFDIDIIEHDGLLAGHWQSAWCALLQARDAGVDAADLALAFHRGLVQWAIDLARYFDVAQFSVGGGCFQNRLLQSLLLQQEIDTGITIHWPTTVPVNDGGLALGQLWSGERNVNIPL